MKLSYSVCIYYLRVGRNEKFQSNVKHHCSHNANGAEFFTKLCMYRVQITLKSVLIKGLNFPLNWNNFSVMFSHWHEKEIILIIHFRYFICVFFSWGRYFIKLKRYWYQVTSLAKSAIIALLAGETFSTINQV